MRCGVLTGLKIGNFLKAPTEYFVQVYIYQSQGDFVWFGIND